VIYSHANGIFSSRRIEAATYRDIAVRCLTADTHPDHSTICAFRRANAAAIHAAFLHVLKLAREMKILKVGTISVDGTRIQANASKYKNVSYNRAGELDKQLELDIAELMRKAESADASEDDEGRRLPAEIARRETLRAKTQKARAQLEQRARERAAAKQAVYEEKVPDAGRKVYSKRKKTVEPTFGIIKHVPGFRQFLVRGIEQVSGEWELVCLAYNVKRLFRLKTA